MVKVIDIRQLNLDELAGVVNLYPWYAGARMELCRRMAADNALSRPLISQTAMYLGSRAFLFNLARARHAVDCSDARVAELLKNCFEQPADSQENLKKSTKSQIFVVGGDWFSQSQYKDVRRADDNIFSSFASKEREDVDIPDTAGDPMDFCTETLAQVYLEQDYVEEARQIYSKLSLRYPEKSVYFATLIEKLDKQK